MTSIPPDDVLQRMFDGSAVGVSVADFDGRWVRGNPAFLKLLGFTAEELEGQRFLDFTHPDDRAENDRLWSDLWRGEIERFTFEKRFLRKDGTAVWTRITATLASHKRWAMAMVEDITTLVAERAENAKLRDDLRERLKEQTCLHAVAQRLAEPGPVERLLDSVARELPVAFQFPAFAAAEVSVGSMRASAGSASKGPVLEATFITGAHEAGRVAVWYPQVLETNGAPRFLPEESALLSTIAEMLRVEIDRRRANAAAAASTERLELALSAADMGLWEWDVKSGRIYGSESMASFVGVRGPIDTTVGAMSQWVHPDDRANLYGVLDRVARQPHAEIDDFEFRFARPDGGYRQLLAQAFVTHDEQGNATRVLALLTDISVRRALEESVRAADQLEAFGLVTGGVAHDFNNILAAMLSGSQLLRSSLPRGPARDAASALETVVLRGAELTKQLMLFSRKEAFRRNAVDMAALVKRNAPLLQRLLGEGIELVTDLCDDCIALGNAEQLDHLLVIFALNAKEAMPSGGRCTIRVKPAPMTDALVDAWPEARLSKMFCLSFSDTGVGMTPQVLARAFEPHFTTRPGASGLGLSVALIVAQQHEGHLALESTPGSGTTVKLYLALDE